MPLDHCAFCGAPVGPHPIVVTSAEFPHEEAACQPDHAARLRAARTTR
jgi:hypothetical protein